MKETTRSDCSEYGTIRMPSLVIPGEVAACYNISSALAVNALARTIVNQSSTMAEYKKRRQKDQSRFLAAYVIYGSVASATRACHIGTTSRYAWMQHDPEYPSKFVNAQKMCASLLEEAARVRAIEGMREYKFYKGKPILHPVTGEPYYVLKYSDTLLIRLLEANGPESLVVRCSMAAKQRTRFLMGMLPR